MADAASCLRPYRVWRTHHRPPNLRPGERLSNASPEAPSSLERGSNHARLSRFKTYGQIPSSRLGGRWRDGFREPEPGADRQDLRVGNLERAFGQDQTGAGADAAIREPWR